MEPGGWSEPLFDAAGMRGIDRWAIEERGVPSLDLMEAAGDALARETELIARPGPVRILCGKGNNGGDGLVAARLLRERGHEVDVLLLWPADELSGDAAANLERLGGGFSELGGDAGAALAGSGAIVDAIFGTGFDGEPREPAAAAIEALNAAGAPVVACDVASGVDASTGEAADCSVDADVTVTFHAAKVGHRIAPGKWRGGRLVVADIGIPPGAPGEAVAGLIGDGVLDLPPRRGQESSKFSSGEVLVVGGSRGMTGAVCMASTAAIRAGAGYATVAAPDSLEPILEVKLTEVMTMGLDSSAGGLGAAAAGPIIDRSQRSACVVLGPGLGRAEHSARLARELAPRIDAPLLIDADGLNALGTELGLLAGREHPTILTPHAGELARLLDTSSDEISAHRLAAAREAADAADAVVVLKGDDTIVAEGDRIAVNAHGSPALATAGTGDVLSGTIAALVARGTERLRGRLRRRPRPRSGGKHRRRGDRGRIRDRERRDRGASAGAPALSELDPFQRATAIVDVDAVERNCSHLSGVIGDGVRLCAVVKANGYGHGMVECAEAAMRGGAKALAVAAASEAFELRERMPRAPILLMGALTSAELDVALQAQAELNVWRQGFLEEVAERGEQLGVRPRIHVKYDTGMGRLGERDADAVDELLDVCAEDDRVDLAGLWTHFATADEDDEGYLREQLDRFAALALPARDRHPGLIVHAANSAATLKGAEFHFDMVRCGVAIYGLDPFGRDASAQGLRPAMSLQSYLADVKRFGPGESAGYGRTWRAAGRPPSA